ncbi:MAG: FAD-dependent oxidoreductase [Haloarculaceae archaeon]
MTDFDVAVVGAGRAGTAAAYRLARDGVDVALLDRARQPGMKNVTGGVIYGEVLADLVPEFPEEAPLGRHVVEHNVRMLNDGASIGVSYRDPAIRGEPNYTVQLGEFDPWFVERAEEQGAVFVPETTVRSVDQHEDGVVLGTDRPDGELTCEAVVGADGVNTTVGRTTGIRDTVRSGDVGLSVKRVVDLDRETVDERFNLRSGEGAAYIFAGFPEGAPSVGYFLYTFESSISVGAVGNMATLEEFGDEGYSGRGTALYDMLDRFVELEAVKPLVRGGTTTEYQGILVPEFGYRNLPDRQAGRICLVGDAAGLVLNKGFTFRGLDFGVESGIRAAEAAVQCADGGDWSTFGRRYDDLLDDSYVMDELRQHRRLPSFLENERLYDAYPGMAREVLERTFSSAGDASGLTWRHALAALRNRDVRLRDLVRDGWRAFRSV